MARHRVYTGERFAIETDVVPDMVRNMRTHTGMGHGHWAWRTVHGGLCASGPYRRRNPIYTECVTLVCNPDQKVIVWYGDAEAFDSLSGAMIAKRCLGTDLYRPLFDARFRQDSSRWADALEDLQDLFNTELVRLDVPPKRRRSTVPRLERPTECKEPDDEDYLRGMAEAAQDVQRSLRRSR